MGKLKKIFYGLIMCLCMLLLPIGAKETLAATAYKISVNDVSHGTITLQNDKTTAEKNEKINISVSPEEGYAIKYLRVKSADGQSLNISRKDKMYEFSMPSADVSIEAGFTEKRIFKIHGTNPINRAMDSSMTVNGIKLFNKDGLEFIPESLAIKSATNPMSSANVDTYFVTDGVYTLKQYNTTLDVIQEKDIEIKENSDIYYGLISISLGKIDGKYTSNIGLDLLVKDTQNNEILPFDTTIVKENSGVRNAKYLVEAPLNTSTQYRIEAKATDLDYKIKEEAVYTEPIQLMSPTVSTITYDLTSSKKEAEATFYISKGANANIYLHTGKAYAKKTKVAPTAVDTESNAEYDIYTFNGMNGEGCWIVCGGGETPYKRTALQFTFKEKDKDHPVTIDLKKKNEEITHTPWLLENDLYTNVSESYMTPKKNAKNTLEGFRVQQTVNSAIGNDFIDPEMHYDIIYGDSVTLTSTGAIGREYQTMRAVGTGISVIKVTYDDLDYREISLDDSKYDDYLYCDAIDPVNTGIVIVNVGGTSKGITSNIDLTDFDTVYIPKKTILPNGREIEGAETVPYTFKPTSENGEITVSTHDPIHLNENWESGWTEYTADAEGNYTIQLKEGRNIVCIKSGNSVLYKVINAKKLVTTVKNTTRNGKIPQNGDVISVSFKGLELPVYKMCGIYNPGYPDQTWVQYYLNDDVLESDHTQYDIEKRNTITFAVNDTKDIVLSSGKIHCVHLGSELYAHCKINTSGQAPNLSATTGKNSPYFDILPDITIPVVGKEVGVMDLIDAIDPSNNYLDSVEAIRTAKDAYELLTDEEKAKVTNVEKLNTAYAAVEDIIKVIEAIDALPEEITLEQRDAVEAANAAYTALTPERQKAVSNADKLQNAVETMQGLVTRQDQIDAVVAKINALPEAAKLTKADAEAVAAARAAYDALTADEQEAVDTEKLTAAETQLGYIDAADSAMEAIAAIGEVTLDNYETKYELIVTARSAYDNLADGAKALVTNLDVLTKAEETYQVMDEDVKEVIDAINQLKDPLSKSSANMDANALKGIWNEYTYVVVNIRGLADELTKDKQAIVTNMKDLETAEAYIQKIKDYDQELAKQKTAALIATDKYDQAKKLLSAEGFPKFADYDPTKADKKDITEVAAQVAQAKAVVYRLTEEQKTALDNELGAGTIKNLNDLAELAEAVDGYENQYNTTQDELDKAAEKIGDEAAASQYVSELTEVYKTYKDKEVSRSDIAIIRQTIKAYDDLTDAQKDIIKNAEDASTITAMLNALKKQDEQVQKDEKAAAEVTEYIKNLPTSLNLDNMEAVRSDLQMIADKYNALNANAQHYVRMLSKVTATNNVLNTMTAEINTFRQGKPAVTAAATAYNSVTVSWNTYQYAQSYDVYRKTAGGEWTKLGNTTALQYVDQTAAGSTAYSYTVVALSSRWGQSVSSAYDENGAAVTTPAAPQPDNGNTTPDNGNTTPDNNNTPAVKDYTSLKATSAGVSSIKLSWKKVSKASGYVVYRANSVNGKYKAIKTIKKGKTTSFTDKKRTTGKTYYYKLRPYKTVKNKKQYMDYSSVVSTKAVPGRVKFTKLTAKNQKATLKWKKVSGASGYLLYRSDRRDGGFTCINSVSSRKTSYTNTKLKKGQTYYYRIRAYRKVGGKRVYGNFSVVKAVKAK